MAASNETIKVSVIIYVKNTVDYIEQCITSVRNQTLDEMEILIVDGGSTDGTWEIIEKMREQDDRIRTFDAPASVGAQFNLGLREARGQYIGICEADDYIPADMYERQYRIARENHLDVLRAGYYQVCSIDGKEYRFEHKSCWNPKWMDKVIENDGFFFLGEAVNGFWSGLYSRQFLEDHGIGMNETKGASYQDISISFLTQMYAKRIWFMKEAFYCYRIDNPNASTFSLRSIELHNREYEELKKQLVSRGRWESYKTVFFGWELLSYRWILRRLSKEVRGTEMEKVYRYLRGQIEEHGNGSESVMVPVQELEEALLKGKADFSEKVLEGIENSEGLLAYIKSSFREDSPILLFGVGQIGKILKEFLELHQKEVILLDNSSKLQATGFMGQRVFLPEEAVESFPDEKIIIASAIHGQEMKGQLLALGVQEGQIFICDDEEFLLREIFVRTAVYGEERQR